ncbi:Transcription regulator [contains diacylglycerol kinase catalytic domain] [hydrothermal vent metagenome]|uniref:Transcription regulator [contains diacylglycerol kinase catalytic domain] n=1 Tax=hydrothermal vent metagenome TaxID=652676 RepID=A0A3B0UHZ7_9ZZZZ
MQQTLQKKKKLLFIVNPTSGIHRHIRLTEAINKHINTQKFVSEIKKTNYAGHAVELSREAVRQKTDIVIAVGGDGTINEVASQIIGSDTVLGIIPQGSGNGLARHLGIPRTIQGAMRLINRQHVTEIDTASINGVPFVSIAGVGFDALIAKLFAKGERRGFFSYAHLISTNFLYYKPKKYQLKFEDGNTLKTKALFISFANSNQFGYNTAIAPNALLRDGKLDVIVVQKPGIFELPLIANLLLLRAIDMSRYVQSFRSEHFWVYQKKNRVVNIDGEARKIDKKLEVKVHPLSLKIIIPNHVIK